MATLPDLDTANTGFVAFWNAIDQGGVGSIDPSEALSDNGLAEYTLYDNGFEGQYNLGHITSNVAQNVTVRMKTDGWIVAYTDRTNSFATESGSPPIGYWDIINDWTDYTSASSITQNLLERAINNLRQSLSNSSSMTYNSGDVGLYNYEHSSATNVTLLSGYYHISGQGFDAHYGYTETYGFVYTSDTTRLYQAATGRASTGGGANRDTTHSRTEFEGVTVSDTSTGAYGAYDVLTNGTAPNSGTEYTQSNVLGDAYDYNDTYGNVNNLVIWN